MYRNKEAAMKSGEKHRAHQIDAVCARIHLRNVWNPRRKVDFAADSRSQLVEVVLLGRKVTFARIAFNLRRISFL